MYDKTIASDFRIYSITLPGSPTLIYDLLDSASKTDYDEIVGMKPLNLGLSSNRQSTGQPHNRYIRHVIDGYIESYAGTFNVYSDAYPTISAAEIVPENFQYTIPTYDWPHKTYVSGSGSVIIRVFFS